MIVSLSDLTSSFDQLLRCAEIPDYDQAHNGLQLSNSSGQVSHIASAVDASLPAIQAAVEAGADLLIVHHGLFWSPLTPITGHRFSKLKAAIKADLAIYSAHIPLDVHPSLGNNALLAQALHIDAPTIPFFPWRGIQLGMRLILDTPLPRDTLLASVAQATGTSPHLCPAGPDLVSDLGVITGGAGSEIEAAAATGIDTFLTGEGPHWSYPLAQELGVNLIYAGHYATETFGVRALATHACSLHHLIHTPLDLPTGL
jgi:dinuclear metal center YbgI/SA1388 family protein